jgi:prepilin-type N-terminal cleavage/methylation domain-containing protein/prepilin-type processing-associated H-X9-DG protein
MNTTPHRQPVENAALRQAGVVAQNCILPYRGFAIRKAREISGARRSLGAFTLTELLVVLAIITLLAAVLLPVITRVQAKSRLTVCTANLNQVAQAVLKYAQANQQTMPVMVNKPPGGWWWYKEQVKQYAGLSGPSAPDKVFACPADRGYDTGADKLAPFHADPKHNYTSYVFNGINLPGMPNIGGRPVAAIQQPARTLMVMEWTAHAPLSWHKSLTGRANAPFYSDAESVVAFVDGHVKLIKIYYDGMNPAYSRDPIPGYEYKYRAD